MENKYQHKIITIPNIISFIRILVIPFGIYFYCFADKHVIAFLILAFACLSDMVDGYIARHFNMISDFGKGLDAIADKLMQFSMLICAATKYSLIIVLVTLLFIKEIVSGIYCLRCINLTGKINSADMVGKISTFCLDVTVLIVLLFKKVPIFVVAILTIICALSMIVSYYWYVSLFRNTIKEEKAKNISENA